MVGRSISWSMRERECESDVPDERVLVVAGNTMGSKLLAEWGWVTGWKSGEVGGVINFEKGRTSRLRGWEEGAEIFLNQQAPVSPRPVVPFPALSWPSTFTFRRVRFQSQGLST